METKELNNGVKIPLIGVGTWEMGGEVCMNAVEKALGFGYRHIDTAEIYGNEKEIGKAINGFERKKLFITSKLWPSHYSYVGVKKSFEESVRKLGTDYLDLYLLHWPKKGTNMGEVLRGIKELYDKKKIRAFGVSNFTIHHLKDMIPLAKEAGVPISVNQVEFHPMLYQKELLEFCNKNKIAVTAYSPLARGAIIGNEKIREISEKYKKTPSQISLRWLLQKGIVAIPKGSNEKHLKENLEVFDFNIKKEDIKKIDSLGNKLRMVSFSFSEFDY